MAPYSKAQEAVIVSFASVLTDLKNMHRVYLQRSARESFLSADDPLQLNELDIRDWHFAPSDPPLLSDADIRKWSIETGLSRSDLYDGIAIYLARRFNSGAFDFGFCDEMVNGIHGVISHTEEARPYLFWNVFLAFDSGEFFPDNDRTLDPIETYTRPLIRNLIDEYSHQYPDLGPD